MTDGLLTTEAAAEYLGLGKSTLNLWRSIGTGPKFIRLGDKPQSKVAYRKEDLDAWIATHVETPTDK
jgi:predicted DNA-binding transcriptional regulator AlpA